MLNELKECVAAVTLLSKYKADTKNLESVEIKEKIQDFENELSVSCENLLNKIKESVSGDSGEIKVAIKNLTINIYERPKKKVKANTSNGGVN